MLSKRVKIEAGGQGNSKKNAESKAATNMRDILLKRQKLKDLDIPSTKVDYFTVSKSIVIYTYKTEAFVFLIF